jgi:hypothetical protein
MGYFTDIICESKKPVNESQRVTWDMVSVKARTDPDDLPGKTYSYVSEKNEPGAAHNPIHLIPIAWKEGDRSAEYVPDRAQPDVTDTRQVVGLLPHEYTGKYGLQEAKEIVKTDPNPGTREQIGLKSRRVVISANTEQKSHFNDAVSTGTESVGLEDAFVMEPLSNRRVERLREESAETQGSGKAGETTRAGATTPSIHSIISTRSNDQIAAIKEPEVFSEDTNHEVPEKKESFLMNHEVLSDPIASVKDRTAFQQKSAITSDLMFNDQDEPPSIMEKAEGMPMVRIRRTKNADKNGLPLSPLPPEGQTEQNTIYSLLHQNRRQPRDESTEPQVKIGILEVVVSAENGLNKKRGEGRRLSNPASRNYLRNI